MKCFDNKSMQIIASEVNRIKKNEVVIDRPAKKAQSVADSNLSVLLSSVGGDVTMLEDAFKSFVSKLDPMTADTAIREVMQEMFYPEGQQ